MTNEIIVPKKPDRSWNQKLRNFATGEICSSMDTRTHTKLYIDHKSYGSTAKTVVCYKKDKLYD